MPKITGELSGKTHRLSEWPTASNQPKNWLNEYLLPRAQKAVSFNRGGRLFSLAGKRRRNCAASCRTGDSEDGKISCRFWRGGRREISEHRSLRPERNSVL